MFEKKCKDGEAPNDIALVVFIVVLMGFAGRVLSYGEEIRRIRDDEAETHKDLSIKTIVIALVMQCLAIAFYYQRYNSCDAVTGFCVFVVVTAFSAFTLTIVLRPSKQMMPFK